MRVVLRHTKTGLFLTANQSWTASLEAALCFRHSADAMDAARKFNLREVEVVLDFEEPPHRVSLPLLGA